MTANELAKPDRSATVEILPFSGEDRPAVLQQLQNLGAVLQSAFGFDHLVSRAARLREAFDAGAPVRLVLLFEAPDDIHAKINAAMEFMAAEKMENADPHPDLYYGQGAPPGALAFLFPGQGSQYLHMAGDLWPAFSEAASVRQVAETHFTGKQSLHDHIYPAMASAEKTARENALRQTDVAQPAIGTVSLLMMKILSRFNVTPEAAAGHSFGELCALYAAGCFDENRLLELAVGRGRLMADAGSADKGTMLAVKAPLEQIESLVRENGVDVILANRNAPDQGVLSGPTEAVEQMKAVCKQHRIRAMVLPVAAAFHSRLVESAAVPFQERLAAVDFRPARIPVYANKTARPYPEDPAAARRLLGEHLVHPVHFLEEIRQMHADGIRTFLEVGPKTVLTGLVKSILKDEPVAAFSVDGSSGRRSGLHDLAAALGRLAALGYPVDFRPWGQRT